MPGHPLTEQILAHWKRTNAFQKSIDSRSPQLPFTFFDGPPFTSGDPHYGHLLQSIIKDMVPRRMTMRGYRVERKRGWDCHGIPAENFVNKILGITSKKQVEEEFGLQNYIEECRTMVNNVNDKRGWFVDHVGRWVDMENAYFTMHNDYMESVIHLFSDLYHNALIYKGFKVLGYSRALGTPLSNHEINEGYQMRQDPAVTVKLTLTGDASLNSEGKYQYTEDGYLETVMGIIKKDDKFLMMYDSKTGTRRVPGGKVDAGESFENAISRELHEEIGVTVTGTTKLGAIKVPHTGKLVKLNYYGVEYTGELENKEPHKCGGLARVSRIESENELGYAIRIEPLHDESSIIDDPERIQSEFQDFDLVANELYTTPGIDTAPISLLAWTTTPWTLPSNMFGAVNKENMYALIYDLAEQEYFVIADVLVSKYYKNPEDYRLVYRLKGKNFLGLRYQPLFEYYYQDENIDPTYHSQVHTIVHGDFVTTESGTGIAHQAPAYGEDDYNLIATYLPKDQAKDWLFDPVDQHGDFTDAVPDFAGMNIIEANKPIIQALKEKGVLVKVETIDHSYPHCPRTKTPLIYKAIESRFVKEDQLKQKTLPSAEKLHFVPSAVKKRFTNGLASAPDWNISRTRFWGCPLPVWENPEDPEERVVVGTIQEIYELNKQKGQIEKKGAEYFYTNTGKPVDLHRPYIDDIILVNPETGNELHRIPEVLDCWFESGSMPYGQVHWMKNSSTGLEGQDSSLRLEGRGYPTADFIAEGLDQTRGWFRALHVLANAYLGQSVYQNVVVTGMILAEDGKKMSKSLQNYPDPSGLINQYGADPLRLYFLSSPVVRGEPLRFSEQGVEQMLKDFVIPLQNVWKFLKTYAEVDDWAHDGTEMYFMRHATRRTGNAILSLSEKGLNSGLSSEGIESLTSQEFIEKVLRINPDVIVTSPYLRCKQTAEGVQHVLHRYADTDREIIEETRLGSDAGDHIQDLIIERKHTGKKVLFVSHNEQWRHVNDHYVGSEGGLTYAQTIRLPLIKIHNELDQWIRSELHQMMKELDTSLQNYELEPATKILVDFVEKVTNWYVRRSRRRFWASGMAEDKVAAYTTLREVLETFLKCAAPFAPFVTEKIWLEMQEMKAQHAKNDASLQGEGQMDSIHLTHRPLQSDLYINAQLIEEVETVRKIIKGALYLRAKKQVKVKQPLQKLEFTIL